MSSYDNMIANAAKIGKNAAINPANSVKRNELNGPKSSFTEVLSGVLSESEALKFSKHAALRINSRDIDLSNEQMDRVMGGVEQAGQKGINQSLVLVDGVALLVNVPSKTVVTAISKDSQKIFTNIDGAVIV